jgi:hypothetical protein
VLHISAVRIQAAEDLAMMQQQDPISHPGHLIQMLAGHQDGDSVFAGARPQPRSKQFYSRWNGSEISYI